MVGGGRIAVGIRHTLGRGHERARGGVAVAVERLRNHHSGPWRDADGRAAGRSADHRPDGVRAVTVVVVGRRTAVGEVAPGDDLGGEVGVIGVHAGVDRADPDAATVQAVVTPDRGRADRRQAPVAPAEGPRPPLGPGRVGRAEQPHAAVVLDARHGGIAGEPADLGRPSPQREGVHEPHPPGRPRQAAQKGRLAARGRSPERADQVIGPGVPPSVHLITEGGQHGQGPVGVREAGGKRGRQHRVRRGGRGRRGLRPAGGGTRRRADRGESGEGDERARR
jgi:hypothetical protein